MSERAIRESYHTKHYKVALEEIKNHFDEFCTVCDEEIANLGLFTTPQEKRRELFLYEMYKLILDKPGSIAQFGVRWGREMALFESFRTIFEPYNHSRKIIGFDTFTGYCGVNEKDGKSKQILNGNLTVPDGYCSFLEKLLLDREKLSPLEQYKKFELVQGDVRETFADYLERNPHEIFSLVHLDLNLYEATKSVLQLIKPRLFSGSIVIIDEINLKSLPGETIALMETFDLNSLKLRRLPNMSPTWPAYFEVCK